MLHFFIILELPLPLLITSSRLTIDGSLPSQLNTDFNYGMLGAVINYFYNYCQFVFLKQISFFSYCIVGLLFGSFSRALYTKFGKNYEWSIFFYRILLKVYLTLYEAKG